MTVDTLVVGQSENVAETYVLVQRGTPRPNCLIAVELEAGRDLPQVNECRVYSALGYCLPSSLVEFGGPNLTVGSTTFELSMML